MGIIKTKGIIIASNNMNDNDKMVTLLTPDLGKIGCAAKRSEKAKEYSYGRHSIPMFWGISNL